MKRMKIWRTVMCLLLSVAMIVPFAGCGKKSVNEFSLNCYALTLEEGQSAQIIPSVDASLLKWASSNPSVATVKNGTVTAEKAGTVEITAESATDKAICRVTVTEKAKSVPALSVSSTDVELFIGREFDLQPLFVLDGQKVDASEYTINYSVDVAGVISVADPGRNPALHPPEYRHRAAGCVPVCRYHFRKHPLRQAGCHHGRSCGSCEKGGDL